MISLLLLALIDEEITYGYDLKRRFDRCGGGPWLLNIGQVYGSLGYLRRRGFLVPARVPDTNSRRSYYQVTPKGRKAITRWLKKAPRPLPPIRDDIWLRMLLLDHPDNAALREHLQGAIRHHEEQLTQLRVERSRCVSGLRAREKLPALALEAAIHHTEVHLAWLNDCLALLTVSPTVPTTNGTGSGPGSDHEGNPSKTRTTTPPAAPSPGETPPAA